MSERKKMLKLLSSVEEVDIGVVDDDSKSSLQLQSERDVDAEKGMISGTSRSLPDAPNKNTNSCTGVTTKKRIAAASLSSFVLVAVAALIIAVPSTTSPDNEAPKKAAIARRTKRL